MLANVLTVTNPFHPSVGRLHSTATAPVPLRDLAPVTDRPFIILRNGDAILRADWGAPVNDGDLIVIAMLPQDGGGGGSDVMRVVAMVAIIAFAAWAGPAFAATSMATDMVFATGMSFEAIGAVVSAGAMIAGSALVNAVIPPPKPPTATQSSSLAAPSPTYSANAQGNSARIGAAIPVQYGRMKCFPDFAAQPYADYAGNKQYLHMLFCIGVGKYSIEEIRIEDTAISEWPDIEALVIQPHGRNTLFPSNVETAGEVSGQDVIYNTYLGPFVANSAGTLTNKLSFDMVLPRGLFYANDNGGLSSVSINFQVEAREIDDNGAAVGSWQVLDTKTITKATTTPQRLSYSYKVDEGRYECRVKRTSTKYTSSRYGNDLAWGGLRAYLPDTRDFGNVTLLAIHARVSSNLSMQAARRINVVCTRKLRKWTGTRWTSEKKTRSIAWALADILTETTYGGAQPNNRVDLDKLLELDAIFTARGDFFDGRFDNFMALEEALIKVGQVGRTKHFRQGGISRFFRDQAQTVPVAMFSLRNIVKNSFSIDYLMPSEDTADRVEVSYWDDVKWATQTVPASLPFSSAEKPGKIDLSVGVTSREQAYREGLYHAACNFYRRRGIKFTTEKEGFIPSPGDLIAINHDMPQWGQHCEAVTWDENTLTLVVSEPMAFAETGTHYIGLRKRDGGVSGPWVVTAGATAYTLIFEETPDIDIYTGGDEERTHCTFGVGETWRQPAIVISVRPRGLYQVEIEAVNEDASVHTADVGATAPPVIYSQLTTLNTSPVVRGLLARSSPSDPNVMLLCWEMSPGADYYLIEASSDGEEWTRLGDTTASSYSAAALYGAETLIRVAAVGLTVGPWVTVGYGASSDYMWNEDINIAMWNANSATLMWSY